jgi:hypothetical protein
MTESEWLSCTDPDLLLDFAGSWLSERKLRLFGCACCRRLWPVLAERGSREAVAAAEAVADRVPPSPTASSAARPVAAVFLPPCPCARCAVTAGRNAALAAPWALARPARDAAAVASASTAFAAACLAVAENGRAEDSAAWEAARDSELARQADLFRDLAGNPFRPAAVPDDVLRWNDGTVRRLARSAYEDRAFDRLPILADALEEAGCDNADLLSHCRDLGDHSRGCWALDSLLGLC